MTTTTVDKALQRACLLAARSPRTGLAAATVLLQQAPTLASGWTLTATCLLHLGRLGAAEQAITRARSLDSEDLDALAVQVRILEDAGRGGEAVRRLQEESQRRGDGRLYGQLGTSLLQLGRLEDAASAFERAIALVPGLVSALAGQALVLERSGDPRGAVRFLEPYIRQPSPSPYLVWAWGVAAVRVEDPARVHGIVTSALERAPAGVAWRLRHHQGDVLDRLGCHERAFRAYSAANALRTRPFDGAAHLHAVRRMNRMVTACKPTTAGHRGGRSLLVVGVPRSGTTLVEACLARHPDIAGAGELQDWRLLTLDAARRVGVPPALWFTALAEVEPHLAELGRAYAATLDRLHPNAARVVDKTPANALLLGLIARALPDTVVVHCQRDPVDTAWSCFRQPFGDALAFTTSLPGLADWLRAERETLDVARSHLDLPIVDVHYEDLVRDPEASLRPVIAACGLPWDPEVARHRRSDRRANTASYAQVQEPLYTRSIGRAEPYRPWLGPFIDRWAQNRR